MFAWNSKAIAGLSFEIFKWHSERFWEPTGSRSEVTVPPLDIWQCLKKFLVLTFGGRHDWHLVRPSDEATYYWTSSTVQYIPKVPGPKCHTCKGSENGSRWTRGNSTSKTSLSQLQEEMVLLLLLSLPAYKIMYYSLCICNRTSLSFLFI